MQKLHNKFMEKYEERINTLKTIAQTDIKKYINNEIPLYVNANGILRHVTMDSIEADINNAYLEGLSKLEYKFHKHYYPGYNFDNISFFTGKYYIYSNDIKQTIGIYGAPSYIYELQKKLPGFVITFTECEHNNGILTITF